MTSSDPGALLAHLGSAHDSLKGLQSVLGTLKGSESSLVPSMASELEAAAAASDSLEAQMATALAELDSYMTANNAHRRGRKRAAGKTSLECTYLFSIHGISGFKSLTKALPRAREWGCIDVGSLRE